MNSVKVKIKKNAFFKLQIPNFKPHFCRECVSEMATTPELKILS